MHIYENPMYYIDYCLSQSVAHQFLVASLENYADAFGRYVGLVKKAGELPFGELVESAGLKDPLKAGALRESTAAIDELISRLGEKCFG